MRIGSLCSGYGGLEEGVRSVLGGEVVWQSDIDPGACKILAHRYPGVPNIGDMTTVDWSQVEPVDVITGGTPCQDVSAAGKRAGMRAGTRSGLWSSMCDAIDIIRPSLVVWENVRGVLSAHADSAVEPCPVCVGDERDAHLRALGRVVGDLSELGYDSRWTGLRAADVGAPHGRFRVFVVAWPAADTIGGGRDGRAHDARWGSVERVAAGRGGAVPAPDPDGLGYERGGRARVGWPGPADSGGPAADPDRGRHEGRPEPAGIVGGPDTALCRCTALPHASHHGRQGRPRLTVNAAPLRAGAAESRRARGDRVEWGPYGPAIARWEGVLGRPAPSPTQPGKSGQPRLSARFVEFLMGLPAGWVTDVPGITRNEALKALGNGVVPQQAAAALRLLLPDVAERAA